MAHSNRSTRKEKSLAAKRAKKNAQRAMYKAWAESGENSKSTRFKRKTKASRKVQAVRVTHRNRKNPIPGRSSVTLKQFMKNLKR